MMNRIHTATPGRIYTAPWTDMMNEADTRLWEDPLLKPRKDIDYR